MHRTPDVRETAARIGTLARATRKELGLNQQELALVAAVSRRTIYEIERGKPTVRLDALVAVLSALGIDLRAVPREARGAVWE
jgi:HTH-type transcriptional regulator/antitoxin HipB